ncbi:DNA polymerase III subunit gamma/tau [bacterium]|nr:DNA polymerase III subunit gamma/tau [bacterium]
MSSYVSFSLKYRPQRFEDVIGQEHVSRTLMNALSSGRVAHAYLFSGPRGTGKTSTARVLAKALNCVNGPTAEPCGECEFCRAVQDGRAMDVIEIDAASNRGIDEIRELREKVKYSPAQARHKVYILDEVHMLTTEAFNALLKTLEEPPAHSFFVLATTEPHRVPATILSRCQHFDFRQIPLAGLLTSLRRIADAEGIQFEPEALEAIARAAEGGMRDAESIFDQVVAYTDGAVTLQIVSSVLGVTEAETLAEVADLIAHQDVAASFSLVDRVIAAGKDVGQLMADQTLYLRDLLRISLGSEPSAWRLPGEEGKMRMRDQASAIGSDRLMQVLRALAEAQNDLRASTQHSLLLELTLAKLCQLTPPAAAGHRAGAPAAQRAPRPAAARPAAAQAHAASQPPAAVAQPSAAPQPPESPAPGPEPAAQPTPAAVAPTPAPEPPAVAPADPITTGPLHFEDIVANWSAMPDELKRMRRMPVGAFICEAAPVSLDGDTLTVAFGPEYAFHHKQVSGPYHEVIEEALARLFGRKLRLVCVVGEVPAQTPPPPAAVPEPTQAAEASAGAEPQEQPAAEPAPQEATPQATTSQEPAEEPAAQPAAESATAQPPAPVAQPRESSAVDTAVAQALSLFEGSTLLGDEE